MSKTERTSKASSGRMTLPTLCLLLSSSLSFSSFSLGANPGLPAKQNSSAFSGTTLNNTQASRYRILWSVELEAGRKEDSLANQASQVGTRLKLDFTSEFSQSMSLNLTPTLQYQNGFYQSLDATPAAQTQFDLQNASFDLRPLPEIQLSAGALNQQQFHQSLMFYRKSFPALRAAYFSDRKMSNRFSAFLEAAIPSSVANTNSQNDFAKSPSLSMGGLGYEFGSVLDTGLQIQANVFSFQGLSTQLANSAILLGNSGLPLNSTDYRFQFEYQGFDGTLAARTRLGPRSSIGGLVTGILNSQAPSGSNLGWKTHFDFQVSLNSRWQLTPSLSYFRIEEDATVAIYNAWMMNTNRQGYVGSLEFKFKQAMKFGLQLMERNAILEKNRTQPYEKVISVFVETLDAEI